MYHLQHNASQGIPPPKIPKSDGTYSSQDTGTDVLQSSQSVPSHELLGSNNILSSFSLEEFEGLDDFSPSSDFVHVPMTSTPVHAQSSGGTTFSQEELLNCIYYEISRTTELTRLPPSIAFSLSSAASSGTSPSCVNSTLRKEWLSYLTPNISKLTSP
ncbi:hypothetical protein GEMRC1_011929 [Eukaryota sp. GEM-RC1]